MRRLELPEGWRRIWIVARREIRERGGSRSYRISTVLAVLLVAAVIVIPSLLEASKTYHVGLTGAIQPGTVTALDAQSKAVDHRLETTPYSTLAEAERAVRDKKVDVLLVDGNRLEWRAKSDSTLTAVVANAVQAVHIQQRADQLGLSADQLARLLVPVTLTSRTIGVSHTADKDANTVGLIAVGALYVAISFYAGFVLTGVVQEKSNRVAEFSLRGCPPTKCWRAGWSSPTVASVLAARLPHACAPDISLSHPAGLSGLSCRTRPANDRPGMRRVEPTGFCPPLDRFDGRKHPMTHTQAQALMQMPDGDGTVAGPTFEYVRPELR